MLLMFCVSSKKQKTKKTHYWLKLLLQNRKLGVDEEGDYKNVMWKVILQHACIGLIKSEGI